MHADMVAGPTGLLVATWPSGEGVATKVPNLRVAGAGMSVSAIASTFKKPSSSPNMNKKRRVLVVGNIAGGEEDRAQSYRGCGAGRPGCSAYSGLDHHVL